MNKNNGRKDTGRLPTRILHGLFVSSIILFAISQFAFQHGGNDYKSHLLGVVKHRNSKSIRQSPWGVQIGAMDKQYVELAAKIGIKWTRLVLSWDQVEKTKGNYSWTDSDTAFAVALSNGITPFICLTGSNRLYCPEGAVDERQKEIYGTSLLPPVAAGEDAMNAWLKFVQGAVERYKNSIKYWEIWNEPNHPHYWGTEPNGEEYGKLLSATADIIKSTNANAKVIGGALAGLDPEFTDKFLANGNAHKIDIITFHNYAELPEERIYKALETWSVIKKYNSSLELWQGECGYPSSSNTRDYRGTSPWGITIQAKWLLRQAFTDIFFCKTTLSNYFKLIHQGGRGQMPTRKFLTAIDSVLGYPAKGGTRVKSIGVNEKCILENPSLKPKPAYEAYSHLCAVFDNRYHRVKSCTKVKIIDQGIFYGIGAEDDAFPSIPLVATFRSDSGDCFIAYWLPWHPQELIREGTVTIHAMNIAYRNPVLVDLLSGSVFPVDVTNNDDGSCTLNNVPLADYPFIIAERDEIDLE
jgi:hypothetical protein